MQNVGSNAITDITKMKRLLFLLGTSDLFKIGVYQLIGGIGGLLIFVWGIYDKSFEGSIVELFQLICPLFFLYSIFCGILCFKNERNALGYTLFNQLLQIAGFSVMGIRYKYVAGFYFDMGINLSQSLHLQFGMGIPTFNLFLNYPEEVIMFDFNWVAIILAYWIFKLQEFKRQEALYDEVDSLLEQ